MGDRNAFLMGAGVGAGLMYVLDPERGSRRRALVRDAMVHAVNKGNAAMDATRRDMANRARGVVAELRSFARRDEDVSDDVLMARVRSQLGHYSSHPGSIEVSAAGGRVTLLGPILAAEADRLLRAVGRVRGVREVESRLDVHERPDDVPGLQGGIPRSGRRFELLQTSWSPTARVLVGMTGMALLASVLARRGAVSGLVASIGSGFLARAATNRGMRRLVGSGGRPRRAGVRRAEDLHMPVEPGRLTH